MVTSTDRNKETRFGALPEGLNLVAKAYVSHKASPNRFAVVVFHQRASPGTVC